MTDIFTVIFTSMIDNEAESIPWTVSFANIDLAKNHVLEEAAATVRDFYAQHPKDDPVECPNGWLEGEEYASFTQQYLDGIKDVWLIVRTELVEAMPTSEHYSAL
jgi:hypothetical protein